MNAETFREVMEELEAEYQDMIRVYRANGKQPYEAGRVDGAKAIIEKLVKILPGGNYES